MSQLAVRLPAITAQLVLALVVLTSLFLLFLVTMDQGAALAAVSSTLNAATTHELFHDARHLLGVPCH
jgi:hypothetical protein